MTYYQPETDTIPLNFLGGLWGFCSLKSEEFNLDTKLHTVILDYYADSTFISKAKTLKYIVKENDDKSFTLLSTELLYDSGFDVVGCLI